MKRVAKLLSIILLATLAFSGCGLSDESNSKKAAEQFVNKLYTVDAKQVKLYSDSMELQDNSVESLKKAVEDLNLIDKNIQPIMTSAGYEAFRVNREGTMYVQLCAKNDYTMKTTEITLTKRHYDSKENDAGYDYKVKVKLISNKDKKELSDVARGIIELAKENGQWKISADAIIDGPNLLINMK